MVQLMTTSHAVRGASGRVPLLSSIAARASLAACSVGLALAPLTAQAGQGAAEQLLRDAFWQQASGAADSQVQQGFRRAVDADGPSSVRARALWLLAQHDMEHGRKEVAIRSLERLSVEFPAEGLLLASARRALADWTRADVALSFEEWDRQRKSSPEFFQRLVTRIEELGGEKRFKERTQLRNEILAMGSAAVPALQSAAASSQQDLSREATRMLFRLKAIPPTIALLRTTDWLTSSSAWRRLLNLDSGARGRLRSELLQFGRTDATPFLMWLTHSQQSLPEFLDGKHWPSDLLGEFTEIAAAIYGGMNPRERPAIASLARAQHVSPEIRRGLEQAALEYEWPGATASQWIAWGQKALDIEGLIGASGRAAQCLRRDEFDSMQRLIEMAAEIPQANREEYLIGIYESLGRVPNPTEVPINRDVLASMLNQLEYCAPGEFLLRASNQDRFVDLLVETLFSSEKFLQMFAERLIGDLLVIDDVGGWARSRKFVGAAFNWFDQRFKDWSPQHRRLALRALAKEEAMIALAGNLFEVRLEQLIRKTGDPSIRRMLDDDVDPEAPVEGSAGHGADGSRPNDKSKPSDKD